MAHPASSHQAHDVHTQRLRLYGPNTSLSYKQPLHITAGDGCWLVDETGRRFLDCVNNVAHVGHANPRVAAAVAGQLCCLNTNSRYLSGELTAYCQELVDTLPAPLQTAYLVNSGSEANDLALRIASAAADARGAASAAIITSGGAAAAGRPVAPRGRDHVVVMGGAYHGHLTSLIPLSPYKFWGRGGAGLQDWVHVIPLPDTFRGLNLDGAAAARAVLAEAAAAGGRVVAFFCESIVSCGGQVVLPPGYLASVYAVMRQAGVVCVADEVQTGFGRVGDAFWAFQLQGVTPDIVTMGKPMGNGFPIGGLVTTPALGAAFAEGGMEYFNTFGGCNAAVAAGRAVLREMREQRLQQHAAAMGRHLAVLLSQLQGSFPGVIGDVRGCGLFWGIELVTDCHSKRPAPLLAAAIKEGAKQRGVLLSTDGPVGHVLKLKPPMVFGEPEAELMVQAIREVLLELTAPGCWPDLAAAEELHWHQEAAPILARYAANEQRLQKHLMQPTPPSGSCAAGEAAATAAAADADQTAGPKLLLAQKQQQLGGDSEEEEPLAIRFAALLATTAPGAYGSLGSRTLRSDGSKASMASADSCVMASDSPEGLSE